MGKGRTRKVKGWNERASKENQPREVKGKQKHMRDVSAKGGRKRKGRGVG